MSNCYLHLYGGASVAEIEIERQLAESVSEPLAASKTTYDAFDQWERTLIADINGEPDGACDCHGACLDRARRAKSQWKRAERKQTELLSFFLKHPRDVVMRPDVREALDALAPDEHVRWLQSHGRFPNVPVPEMDSMVAFGEDLLGVEPRSEPVDPAVDEAYDAAWDETTRLLRLDLTARRQLKAGVRHFEDAIVEVGPHVEEGRVFETMRYEAHDGDGQYVVSRVSAKLRSLLTSYQLFVDAYGSYLTRATVNADGGTEPELRDYVGATPGPTVFGAGPTGDGDGDGGAGSGAPGSGDGDEAVEGFDEEEIDELREQIDDLDESDLREEGDDGGDGDDGGE